MPLSQQDTLEDFTFTKEDAIYTTLSLNAALAARYSWRLLSSRFDQEAEKTVSMPLSQQDTLEDEELNNVQLKDEVCVSMPLSQQDTLEVIARNYKNSKRIVSMPLSQQDTLEANTNWKKSI